MIVIIILFIFIILLVSLWQTMNGFVLEPGTAYVEAITRAEVE